LWFAAAHAATWSEPLPASGIVELAAGQPARLEVEPPGAPIRVLDGEVPVELRGTSRGFVVPAEGRSRTLYVFADPGVRVVVRVPDRRDATAAWEHWKAQAVRTIDPGPAPGGGPRLQATVALRNRAIASRSVRRLGVAHDTHDLTPKSRLAVRTRAVADALPAEMEGPGTVVASVQVAPAEGAVARVAATVTIDGIAVDSREIASTGAAPVTLRTWLPPGRHTVSVALSGAPSTATAQVFQVRPRLTAGHGARADTDPERAELAFLRGDRDAALGGFRPLAEVQGDVGELARARIVWLSPDLAEVAASATIREGTSPEGIEVLADAALRRADELPADTVRALVLAARDPDPALVARWLDTDVPGWRPAGVALLDRAPDVPHGRSTRIDAVRELSIATRAQRLPATVPGGVIRFGAGPGIPRARVEAGGSATLNLPPREDGRVTVVRLVADGPSTWRVDGAERSSPGGRVDVAVAPGGHTLEVGSGALVLLDPELAPGTPLLWEWTASAVPASFVLPDPGVPVELFVDAVPPAELLAVFDDGRVERVILPAESTRARLLAGAQARELTLLGPEGTTVSVALRGRVHDAVDAILPRLTTDEAIRRIEDASRRIDAGDRSVRAERAALLASLGQLTAARRDLSALPPDDPDRIRVVRAIAAGIPSRLTPGPVTAEAALAEAGVPEVLPALPLDDRARRIEAATVAHPTPALLAAAAQAWVDAGDAVRGVELARRSGLPEAMDAAMAALSWRSVPSADRSAGLVSVPVVPEPGPPTLARRVRAALLGSPWPASDTLVLRDGTVDVVRIEGAIDVGLWCRDEVGVGGSCVIPIRSGTSRRTVELTDGTGTSLTLDARDLEIGGPGPGRAVVVRLTRDDAVVPPQAERLAIRVTSRTPARLRVAGAQVVRVDVERGSATLRIDDRTASVSSGDSVRLAIVEAAPADVVVEGDGVVLLYAGTTAPMAATDPLAVVPPPVPPSTPDWVDAVLDSFPTPRSAELATPGAVGTFRVAARAFRDVDGAGHLRWQAGGPEVTWMRAFRRQWTQLNAWLDAPGVAAGGFAEIGTRWGLGRTSVSVDVGQAVQPFAAGHVEGRIFVRQEVALSADTRLRADLSAFAGSWSDAPTLGVDPYAWTQFDADHPVGVTPDLSSVMRPWRDVWLKAGGKATTNPNLVSVDRAGPYLSARWLLGTTTVLGAKGTLQWRFADDLRDTTYLRPSIDLLADHMRWITANDRVGVVGRLTWLPAVDAVEGAIELRWELTGGRGLRDLPPNEEMFRTLRESW
jgi:hypothetical protein